MLRKITAEEAVALYIASDARVYILAPIDDLQMKRIRENKNFVYCIDEEGPEQDDQELLGAIQRAMRVDPIKAVDVAIKQDPERRKIEIQDKKSEEKTEISNEKLKFEEITPEEALKAAVEVQKEIESKQRAGRSTIDYDRVKELHSKGYTNDRIAQEVGCSAWSIHQWIKKNGLERNR